MMTNEEKIKIISDRMIILNSTYGLLDLNIVQKNDGNPGSKEWCQNALIELNDIKLVFEALSQELERLNQEYENNIQ